VTRRSRTEVAREIELRGVRSQRGMISAWATFGP